MTVRSVQSDLDAATLTIVAEFDASIDRVWEMWADPRLLERWWGPPTHPATVTDHELVPGGSVRYYMTGPDGERHHGGWRVLEVQRPVRLALEDYFADDEGNADDELPVATTTVTLDESNASTTMTILTSYPSTEALSQALEMGMEEGVRQAIGQIDDLLAA